MANEKSFRQFRLDNIVEEIPEFLDWGQEVYYMDSNGALVLYVGDQAGQAQPAVTRSGIGLGAVNNTADVSKPVSTPQSSAIVTASAVRIWTATLNQTGTSAPSYFAVASSIPGLGLGSQPAWTRQTTGHYRTTLAMPAGMNFDLRYVAMVSHYFEGALSPTNIRHLAVVAVLPGGSNVRLDVRCADINGNPVDVVAFNVALFMEKTTLP
jgi:hypothetical protein